MDLSPWEFETRPGVLSTRKVGDIEVVEYSGRKKVFMAEQQLLHKYKETSESCPLCGKVGKLTIDHIVPMEMLDKFGVSPKNYLIRENLRVTCERCNGYKGNRLDFTLPETKKILQSLLELV